MENNRLCAIILLENQSSIHEGVKSELNDVGCFLRGQEESLCLESVTGELMVWDVCSQWSDYSLYQSSRHMQGLLSAWSLSVATLRFQKATNVLKFGINTDVWQYKLICVEMHHWFNGFCKKMKEERKIKDTTIFNIFPTQLLIAHFPWRLKKYGWTMRPPRGGTID